jgi:hypothetical protein
MGAEWTALVTCGVVWAGVMGAAWAADAPAKLSAPTARAALDAVTIQARDKPERALRWFNPAPLAPVVLDRNETKPSSNKDPRSRVKATGSFVYGDASTGPG